MGEPMTQADVATLREAAIEFRDWAKGETQYPTPNDCRIYARLAVEVGALADVLAALTPEVVAALTSARHYRWPHAGPEERATLDAGIAALARLHSAAGEGR